MLDFFTALTQPKSSLPTLKPRLPALFEPIGTRVEMGMVEDYSESEVQEAQGTPSSIQRRSEGRDETQEMGRERAPYRGVMNVLPLARVAQGEDETSSEGNVKRDGQRDAGVRAPIQTATGAAETGGEAETKRASNAEHERMSMPQKVTAIRPAIVSEPQRGETRGEPRLEDKNAPQTAPIVRVNIGRIVVRAVSGASSAPVKRQVESKKLSLDEYLGKGERGER